MHFKSRTIVFALRTKTLDLFRTNANFMFFVDLGGFRSAVSYRRLRAIGKERLTLQKGSCAVHLPSHKRSEALPRPQSPLGCQPFDCYLSIQLVEVGPTITHHPGPGLFNLARCQMNLAYMFGLLRETSKSHLFWRSLRLSSLRYRMTGLCICTSLPPCGWGFAKLMWTKSSTIVRDDCKFVPWRHFDLKWSVQLFNLY